MRLFRTHILLLILPLVLTSTAIAQDSTAFYVLNAEDMAIANVQNLEEALVLVPGMHHYSSDGISHTTFGTLSTGQIAIFKDDLPLAMDQNVGVNLRVIPTWDLNHIEVHIASVSTLIKNSSSLIIRLYTRGFQKKSVWGSASLITSSTNDLSTNIRLGLSNIQHNLNVGVHRNFQSSIYKTDGLRSTLWGGEERRDLNLHYRYNIIGSVVLDVQSDHTALLKKDKGQIIPNTTRVRDRNTIFSSNTLSSRLFAPISKNHSITLSGKLHRYSANNQEIDKDLNTGEEAPYTNTSLLDNGYRYGYMRLLLTSENKKLNYDAGLELSSTKDLVFGNVNAIATEYSDYAAFANIQFLQKNTVLLKGGAKLLVNNLIGYHFLPNGSIVLAPSSVVQLTGSYIRSLSYPSFNQIFYNTPMNSGVAGNVRLQPIKQNTISINLQLGNGALTAQSGLLYVQSNNVIRISEQQSYANTGASSTTSLYSVIKYHTKRVELRPYFVLHSNNYVRDSLGITYVHPQLGLLAKVNLPKLGTSAGFIIHNNGTHTKLSREQEVIYQTEIAPIRRVSVYAAQSLLADKLSIGISLNNQATNTLVQQNEYRVGVLENILLQSSDVLASRNQNISIHLSYLL
ncbi:TonB-dependent receptor [Bacteroidia bacterium]|nr:TonB-dependent receptor [Bacteroidia bacterium]